MKLHIYNTLSRKKEEFKSLKEGFVGMYVCGPTVYGESHLGHARAAITFDILFRALRGHKYTVRYVRNITDVGHMTTDDDSGLDKVTEKAKTEQLEPMEVVQRYTLDYRKKMEQLNVLPPSIEPTASGHIIEQIEVIKKILKAGYAYEKNGSVYFDVEKYNSQYTYGELSGRDVEEMLSNTRALVGQAEKKNAYDFALWKRADERHIMRWVSPWGDGFPGWHLECSAMGEKYLGDEFDIHGGGLDLMFPHHEAELAQNRVAFQKKTVKYWMHNNMITIDGKKMGKSLGNFITLSQFFSGEHELLEEAYDPMTIRFFILQAHYRSTLDFSNQALQASRKGLQRLLRIVYNVNRITVGENSSVDILEWEQKLWTAINDDLNTPVLIAHLFDMSSMVHALLENRETISQKDKEKLIEMLSFFIYDILGITPSRTEENLDVIVEGLMKLLMKSRDEAKRNKDYAQADAIRDELKALGIILKDGIQGTEYEVLT